MGIYDNFVYPLEAPGKVISTPEQHAQRALGNWQSDRAADVGTPMRTPVYAVTDGTISPQGYNMGYNDGMANPKLKGWRFSEAFDDRSDVAFYQHLDELAPGINRGTHVNAGDLLGWSGEGGEQHTPHLHISLKNGDIMDLLNQAGQQGGEGAEPPDAANETAGVWQQVTQICDSITSSFTAYLSGGGEGGPFTGAEPYEVPGGAPYTGAEPTAGGGVAPYSGYDPTIVTGVAPYTGSGAQGDFSNVGTEVTDAVAGSLGGYNQQTAAPYTGAEPIGDGEVAPYSGAEPITGTAIEEPVETPPEPPEQNYTPPEPNFTPPEPPEQNYTPPEPNFTPPEPPEQNYTPPEPPEQNFTPAPEPSFTPPEPMDTPDAGVGGGAGDAGEERD